MALPVDASGRVASLPQDEQLLQTLAKNVQEHQKESASSCEVFYCASGAGGDAAARAYVPPPMDKYTMGPVPSNDYPLAFTHSEEQIFVSREPLFDAAECERVIALAEAEGSGLPPATSGKYEIGRAWVKEMPGVLGWFNDALRDKLFPTLHALFGGLVRSPDELRAHTVRCAAPSPLAVPCGLCTPYAMPVERHTSHVTRRTPWQLAALLTERVLTLVPQVLIAKYNGSDATARSDVHVDDALLALTIALSPTTSYEGGGSAPPPLQTRRGGAWRRVAARGGAGRRGAAPCCGDERDRSSWPLVVRCHSIL
jgi:hypothetical protein